MKQEKQMFKASVSRLVDSYYQKSLNFRTFLHAVNLSIHGENVIVKVNGNVVAQMTKETYTNATQSLTNAIGSSNQRRTFALYCHLVGQGVKLN